MSENNEPIPTSRAVTRRELELVIRRAVELATEQADAGDAIPEDEVVRIAREVGLAPEYVRKALFDLPTLRREQHPTLAARALGPCVAVAQRVLPGDEDDLLLLIERYLTVHQYLQVRRHVSGQMLLAPADDVFTKMVRGFTRSKSRFHMANASSVGVLAQPAEPGYTRVRFEIDLDDRRRSNFAGGGVGGTVVGLVAGGGLATAGAFAGLALAGPVGAVVGGVLLGVGGLAATISAGIKIAKRTFARTREAAQGEAEELLDRLQQGGPLEPPTSPFLRGLRERFQAPPRR